MSYNGYSSGESKDSNSLCIPWSCFHCKQSPHAHHLCVLDLGGGVLLLRTAGQPGHRCRCKHMPVNARQYQSFCFDFIKKKGGLLIISLLAALTTPLLWETSSTSVCDKHHKVEGHVKRKQNNNIDETSECSVWSMNQTWVPMPSSSPLLFFFRPPSASQLLFIIKSHLLFLFPFHFLSVLYLLTVFPSWYFSHIRPCIFLLNAVYMIYNQKVHRLGLYEWLLLQKPSLLWSFKCTYCKT